MSHKKQPKLPCKHVMELIDLAIDNGIGIYFVNEDGTKQENVRCTQCNRKYIIDLSGYSRVDENANFFWQEITSNAV